MPASAGLGQSLRRAVRRRRRQQPRSGGVTVPTTYVWGRHDFALGRAAAEKTAELVAADYRFVELNAGHWLPESEAGRCAEEILDRVRSVQA